MKWLIIKGLRARFLSDRIQKKEHKYDSIDLLSGATAASYPLWALEGPIFFFFDFPYEYLIIRLVFITSFLINIVPLFLMRRNGEIEKIMNEVDALPETEVKTCFKENIVIVDFMASTFAIVIFTFGFVES